LTAYRCGSTSQTIISAQRHVAYVSFYLRT